MNNKKKILVLTDDMPWGHRSIAKAIFNFLKDKEEKGNFEVFFREIKANIGIMGDLYTLSYRYSPKSSRIFFKFSKNKLFRQLIEEASVLNLPRLKKEIDVIKPDLIISAYVFHSWSLVRWKKKENKDFKLWTIASDPWTINPVCFIKEADLNIVYDEVSAREGQKWGLDKKEMLITGWWTKMEMYKKYDYKKSREKLGFYDDRPVIFLGGGSLGTSSLPKLLPTILTLDKKVGFVINTGTDKLAFNLINQFQKIFLRLRKGDDTVIIKHLGWIENMAEALSACDMVFGKAGPNFLFEVVAAGKPFVAMTHIGGQEDGNIELIKKKKLGWVKEKNGEISDFLFEYLENPKYFENKFLKNIQIEAKKNEKSLPMILEMINKEFKLD